MRRRLRKFRVGVMALAYLAGVTNGEYGRYFTRRELRTHYRREGRRR